MRLLSGIGWIAWMAWAPSAPAAVGLDAVSDAPMPSLVAPSEESSTLRPATGGLKRRMLAPRHLSDDWFYDVSLGSASLSALLDWHPFGSGFRTTGGVMVNSHEGLEERVLPRGAYGLSPYNAVVSQRRHTLDFYQPTPYLGLGWGRSLGRSHALNLSLDVGVMLESTAAEVAGGAETGLQSSFLGHLTSGDFTALARSLSYSPVVSMGMGWRF